MMQVYDNLKQAFEAGKQKAAESIYYRIMIWPTVRELLRAELIKAYKQEHRRK